MLADATVLTDIATIHSLPPHAMKDDSPPKLKDIPAFQEMNALPAGKHKRNGECKAVLMDLKTKNAMKQATTLTTKFHSLPDRDAKNY